MGVFINHSALTLSFIIRLWVGCGGSSCGETKQMVHFYPSGGPYQGWYRPLTVSGGKNWEAEIRGPFSIVFPYREVP